MTNRGSREQHFYWMRIGQDYVTNKYGCLYPRLYAKTVVRNNEILKVRLHENDWYIFQCLYALLAIQWLFNVKWWISYS